LLIRFLPCAAWRLSKMPRGALPREPEVALAMPAAGGKLKGFFV
jgi:hypothetical protein